MQGHNKYHSLCLYYTHYHIRSYSVIGSRVNSPTQVVKRQTAARAGVPSDMLGTYKCIDNISYKNRVIYLMQMI